MSRTLVLERMTSVVVTGSSVISGRNGKEELR